MVHSPLGDMEKKIKQIKKLSLGVLLGHPWLLGPRCWAGAVRLGQDSKNRFRCNINWAHRVGPMEKKYKNKTIVNLGRCWVWPKVLGRRWLVGPSCWAGASLLGQMLGRGTGSMGGIKKIWATPAWLGQVVGPPLVGWATTQKTNSVVTLTGLIALGP